MRLAIVCISMALAAIGAEDTWIKVKRLKSGTEIRIFKTADKAGVIARFHEADDARAVVVVKNEQKSIAKDEIERLEARPPGSWALPRTIRTKPNDPAAGVGRPKPWGSAPVPSLTSSSSSLGFEGKPTFELIYRRATGKQPH